QSKLSAIQYGGAQQNLILQVAQAYFGVLMAQDSLQLTREQKAAVHEQLASAQARFRVGKTNITDVDEAQARYDAILAQELNAQNNLAVQEAQFASVVGKPPGNLAKVPDTFKPHSLEPDDLQHWIDQGLKGNPSVQGARVQVDMSREEIDQYKLTSRPQLDMFASYSDMRGSGFLPILQEPGYSKQTMVGVQLSVPLFAGGAYNSKLREALADNQQAQYQLQATIASTSVQIKQQYLNIQVGVPQIAALQQAVVAAKSSLDANILGEKVGVRNLTDVLNAQQQYYSTLQNLDAARYQYLLSTLNLSALVGTLSMQDVRAVNGYLAKSGD
ncbi:MAG: TolC family outer membrane protein, partial [Gammaproteobacteria bacterium]|nr:TolC family outer membrane protein [Gammaproteobacteria bacterium]